jgi:hypothetical protein
MKILIEASTSQVLYADDSLVLSESGISGSKWRASNIKHPNYELLEVSSIPSDYQGRHYTYVDGTWIRTSIGLEAAKTAKKAEIKSLFLSKMQKPIIDTGLGFSVDGGRDNLQDFQGGHALGFYIARDSENVTHQLTKEQMEQVIVKIQANGLALYQRKWELEALVDEDPETDITVGWPV